MISVAKANDLIKLHVKAGGPQILPIEKSKGLILAQDIYSLYNAPAFRQSSMDGYAFIHDDFINGREIKIVNKVAAGDYFEKNLVSGEAVRIFTGAPVPDGADTVVMQEKTRVENDILFIEDNVIRKGTNIREIGSELEKGKLVLSKGEKIKSRTIGFLAGLGIKEISAYPAPKIGIIITGNELQSPGTELEKGKVYESNSYTLTSVLTSMHIHDVQIYYATDNLDHLSNTLAAALITSDMVLLTGGVSVGDFDFVLKAAEQNGLEFIYHKIAQKPGKPMYFGKKDDKYIFGLPGNPGSVLTCFYEYITLALDIYMNQSPTVRPAKAKLNQDYKTSPVLTHFLKGHLENGQVIILDAQESFRLKSFAAANCLIVLPPRESGLYKNGEEVDIHLLPE